MSKNVFPAFVLLVVFSLVGAGCAQLPVATEATPPFDYTTKIPQTWTTVSPVDFDIDGDGVDEHAVRYTVPNVETMPGVRDTVHYVRVFRYQNNEWQVIKEDERHEETGPGQVGQFCLFTPVTFSGVQHEFLLVSKCRAWGANEGYYLFGQIQPGEFGDVEIPKAYLNKELYLTKPGDRDLGLETVEVVADGLIEHYGVTCDDKPDTYGHFGGEEVGYCRTLNVKQTYDKTAFLDAPTIVPDAEPSAPAAYVPVFDGMEAQPGDQVRGMTLDAYTCPFFGECSLSFSGEVEITGRYDAYDDNEPFYGGEVCFSDLDDASLAKVPIEETDTRKVWFCFTYSEGAKSLFPASSGTATIVIDNYHVVMSGREVWNTADLIRVVDVE